MKRLLAFLARTFQRKPHPRSDEPPSDRVQAILDQLHSMARPALRLEPGGEGRSRLGGAPEMSAAWPRYAGRPLSLLASLDLVELRAAGGPDWLPGFGRLLFFYEFENGGWGTDPSDFGSAVVIHQVSEAGIASPPADLPLPRPLAPYPVAFVAITSVPSEERLGLDLTTLSAYEQAELEWAIEALAPHEPDHRVGGYSAPIQGDDMELECELAMHGLPASRKDRLWQARAEELRPGAADWRLLLQLDTDEAAGMLWGDGGRLYFWIREAEARSGDFSRTWTILQCY